MSCYHPLAGIAYYNEYTDKGARKYHIYGSYHPDLKKNLNFADVVKVPCGHCIGCVLDKARNWADRMTLEFISSGNRALFVTLTYNNDFVPIATDENGEPMEYTLCKDDLQKFLKRVRKRFSDREIKFYGCGEYGKNTQRPHYHLILFGLDLQDFPDYVEKGKNELGQKYYISDLFGELWRDPKSKKSYGFHILSEVSYKTCSYVARYCMKKIDSTYNFQYAIPEFHLMSRRPGLGHTYMMQFPELFESDKIFVNDGSEQKEMSIPKYFLNRLKLDNPGAYDKMNLELRSTLANDRELLKLQNTDLSYLDMLEQEEHAKLNKTKILFKRGDM